MTYASTLSLVDSEFVRWAARVVFVAYSAGLVQAEPSGERLDQKENHRSVEVIHASSNSLSFS